MHILITAGASQLAQFLADALQDQHTVRLTERIVLDSAHEFVISPLGHDFATNLLVRNLDAIVHVAEPLPTDNASTQIDILTRGTYNLLMAAAEEGVSRVVFISTLELMAQYDERFIVDERWRPLPTTAPYLLAKSLGESTCREFAREHKLDVVVLRLGHAVYPHALTDAAAAQPIDVLAVDAQDVAQAVASALTAEVGRWSIFHIAPDVPQPRFPVQKARSELGLFQS